MLLWIPLLFQIAQAPPPALAADPNAKPPAPAIVSGKVVDAITGEPLRKVSIVLNPRDRQNAGARFSATSDPGGSFTIRDIPPGSYGLQAQRSGYINQQYGARQANRGAQPIALQPGQEMKDVVFRMWPQGVITGRIVDSDGDPITYANVALQHMTWTSGQKRLQNSSQANTNDLGEYRLFGVSAGKYYLQVTIRNNGRMIAAGAGEAEDYAPSWYPGVGDSRSAVLLDVQPGQTLRGIDMTVQKIPTRRVRGKVISLAPGKNDFIQLMIVSREMATFGPNRNVPIPPGKSEFDIRIAPGSWNLIAFAGGGRGNQGVSARTSLDVGSSDIDNVVLTLTPPGEITGHLRIDGATNLTALADKNVRVTVGMRTGVPMMGGGNSAATVGPDGAFTLKNIISEPLTVFVTGLPQGYYTKSIQFGRQDVKADGLNFAGSADSLEIVISPNAAAVEGVVRKKSGEPVSGASVVLVPPPPLRDSPRNYRTSGTDQQGHYSLTGIEPGKFSLFAWEDIEPGVYYDPDFMRQMENRGKQLDLKESGHETADLDVIPAEETPQTAAQ